MLSDDGRICTALNARIGAATADLHKLSSIWAHSNIGKPRKLEIFKARVMSKLLCCLNSVCLSKTERLQ